MLVGLRLLTVWLAGPFGVQVTCTVWQWVRSVGTLPPTPLDLAIRRAALLPGPQDYNPTDPTAARGGGKFAESTAKSDLEWTLHHAKEIPGPGECKRAMLGTVFSNRAIKAHPIFLWHSL